MNRQLIYTIVAVIVLAAIATLAIKSCSDKSRPVPIAPMKPVNDSVQNLHKRTQLEIDSIKRAFYAVSAQRDSLQYVAMKQSDQLNVNSIKINAISKEYSLYRKYKDTAKALETCDSLSTKVVELTVAVGEQQLANRALQNSNDILIASTTFAIGRLEYDNSVLKQGFDTLYKFSNQLSSNNIKLERKAKKRFAIGPYIGATYTTKVVPSAGLSITYALIKF